MTTFSFRKTAHRCILCVTQSNWAKMWFSRFHVLPGSAEAQVNWGGIVKCVLIAYFIGNISARKYQSIHVCQIYSKPTVGRFLRHGVDHRSFRSDCTDTQIRPVAVRTVPLCGNVKLAPMLTVPNVTATHEAPVCAPIVILLYNSLLLCWFVLS